MHTTSPFRRVLTSLAVTAAATGLTACGGGGGSSDTHEPTAQVPRLDESSCPYTLHASQKSGSGVRCGVLVVAQNRSNPSGPTVRIPFAVFKPATAGTLPPVVYLTGGPGETWNDSLADVQAGSSPGFGGGAKLPRDEVVLEQRGFITTTPSLACPAVSPWGPEMFRNAAAALLAALPGLKSCADGLVAQGVQPRNFTTDDLAADVEDLRRLLGYGKVVLNGVSFGTSWALAVARNHGAGVEAMVLDSVVSPAVFPGRTTAEGTDKAFSAVAAACAAQPACAAAYPDLDSRVSALLASVNANPLPWARGPGGEFNAAVLMGALFTVAQFTPQSFPAAVATFEGLIDNGVSPNTLPAGQQDELANLARAVDSSIAPAAGQLWSIVCADNATTTQAEFAASAQLVRPAMRPFFAAWNETFYSVCQSWPSRRDLPASAYQPLNSPVKTLILSGALDPSTPPSWAQQVASALPNRTLVSFPARAHSVQGASTCARTLVSAFLAGQPVDPSCAAAETLSFE